MHSPSFHQALISSSLAIVENGHWSPGISDPTAMGLVVFVFYFGGAAVCLFRAWRCFHTPALRRGQYRFWAFCAIALLLFWVYPHLNPTQLIPKHDRY